MSQKTGPQLKVSSDRLVKPGIRFETPGTRRATYPNYTTLALCYECIGESSIFPKCQTLKLALCLHIFNMSAIEFIKQVGEKR